MSVHNSNNNNNNNNNSGSKKWSLIRFLIVAAIFLIGLAVTGNLKSFLPFLDWGEDENTGSYTQQIDDIEDVKPDIDIAPEHTETPEPDESESIPNEQTTASTTTTVATTEQTTTTVATTTAPVEQPVEISYYFRNRSTYESHYEKHRDEFGDITREEYLQMANELIASTADTVLTKYDDDGDFMYFDTATGYFLVLSTDGYIRTFFVPTDGIDYWNRQ